MPVPALLSETLLRLLGAQKGELFHMVNALGSPLFCLLPNEFARNITAYLKVLDTDEIRGQLWFATKVNKSMCFLELLRYYGIGADVAAADRNFKLLLDAGYLEHQLVSRVQ